MIVTTQSLSDPSTDEYPLLNNVSDNLSNPKYTDINSITPYNFDLFMANSASKSASETDLAVPSYFPSQAYKIPRYDGSKSTSQKINEWTPGDVGTIGKTPTAESLKTSVAYCDSILSLSPEREDASKVHIKYLINADGTVSVPNSTPNSLQNNQGNFITGENVFISSRDEGINTTSSIGSNNNKPYKKIIRGASRIEPILYNQSGSKPPQWEPSIDMQNQVSTAVGNYVLNGTFNINNVPSKPPGFVYIPTIFAGSSPQILGYTTLVPKPSEPQFTVTQQMKDDNITLTVNTSFRIENKDQNESIIKLLGTRTYDVGLPNTDVRIKCDDPIDLPYTFTINQYPSPGDQPLMTINTSPSPTPSFESLWFKLMNNVNYNESAIITSDPFLLQAYDTNLITPTWYMKDIPNSGYDPILTEWGVKRGDVFRFEGDEKKTFMVDYVTRINDGVDNELIINFPISADLSNINVNRFSLVRYVDDASQIIIEGFRPNNSSAPYILKPEFVVPELDKDIDAFIVDLTQKGLL